MKLPSAGRAAQPAQPARVPLRPDLAADPIADPPNPVSAWNVANALTVFRLVLVPVFLVVLFQGTGTQTGWRLAATAVFWLADANRRATVLADALEAALGALYLDGGLDRARDFVRRAWDGAMIQLAEPPKDAKTALQEWAQKRGGMPVYAVTDRSGPPHAPQFTVTVTVGEVSGTGSAGSKQAAEQAAAEALLRSLTP